MSNLIEPSAATAVIYGILHPGNKLLAKIGASGGEICSVGSLETNTTAS